MEGEIKSLRAENETLKLAQDGGFSDLRQHVHNDVLNQVAFLEQSLQKNIKEENTRFYNVIMGKAPAKGYK